MLFKKTLFFNQLTKMQKFKASWDTKELTIPLKEKPILSLNYDPKYISILGFHNKITESNEIVRSLKSNRRQS